MGSILPIDVLERQRSARSADNIQGKVAKNFTKKHPEEKINQKIFIHHDNTLPILFMKKIRTLPEF